jgi:hypothetical protein
LPCKKSTTADDGERVTFSPADSGRERQCVDERAMVFAIAPFEFEVTLPGCGTDGALIPGELV